MGKNRTLVEAIIGRRSEDRAVPGAICRTGVDFAFANDITAPPAIREFGRVEAERIFDPDRAAVAIDRFTPNKDIASASQVKTCRDFARRHGVHYFAKRRLA